jgi:integrase
MKEVAWQDVEYNFILLAMKKFQSPLRLQVNKGNRGQSKTHCPWIGSPARRRVGVELRPHDLRRHAATYAFRAGTPIEIVSKVILRHSNLSATQRYLGKVTDAEALRWTSLLYG